MEISSILKIVTMDGWEGDVCFIKAILKNYYRQTDMTEGCNEGAEQSRK